MLKTLHLCEDSVDNEPKKNSVKIKLKLNRRFSVISHLPQNRNRSSSWSLWFVQIRERNAPRLSPLHHLVIGQQTLWLIDHDSWLLNTKLQKKFVRLEEKRDNATQLSHNAARLLDGACAASAVAKCWGLNFLCVFFVIFSLRAHDEPKPHFRPRGKAYRRAVESNQMSELSADEVIKATWFIICPTVWLMTWF